MDRWVTMAGRTAVAVILAALVVVAVVGVASSLFGSGEAKPPPQAAGLPVLPVAEAINARAGTTPDQPIAVFGWLSLGPAHSCPAPTGPGGAMHESPAVELHCRRGEQVLAGHPESGVVVTRTANSMSVTRRTPAGPWLDVALLEGSTGVHLLFEADETWLPVPVIAIGHFRDRGAAQCLAENLQFCLDVFAVDRIVRADSPAIEPPAAAKPAAVMGALTARFGARPQLLVLEAATTDFLAFCEDRFAPPREDRYWYAKVIVTAADGVPRLATAVLDSHGTTVLWTSDDD